MTGSWFLDHLWLVPLLPFLGALLIDGSLLARVMELLTSEDFASEAHRAVYDAALALADATPPFDAGLVSAVLGPVRERRRQIVESGVCAREILADGTRRATEVAEAKMAEVRDAVRI